MNPSIPLRARDSQGDNVIEIVTFDNSYLKLPESFYSFNEVSQFPAPQLIRLNKSLAELIGMDVSSISSEELSKVLCGNQKLPGSAMVSMAYSGHQFGQFNPMLGDGRAMLIGETIGIDGLRRDIQLKGSGPSEFSRRGDGKSQLGPVIREYLVSEAMHALGVPTTRSLAIVTTGEQIFRRDVQPGGVLTRVAKSHIRVGTFQYFACRQDINALQSLLNYVVERHYPEVSDSENKAVDFLKDVMENQAKLVAKWLSVGFIHGVMNTDNMTISGETIDYGPCAFMDEYNSNQVYSSIDSYGRYAFGNQKKIALWNLCRLAECLIPLIDDDEKKSIEKIEEVFYQYENVFDTEFYRLMNEKLGFIQHQSLDKMWIQDWLNYLQTHKLDYTNSFRNLANVLLENKSDYFVIDDEYGRLIEIWKNHLRLLDGSLKDIVLKLNEVNPKYIPRNHLVEKAIQNAVQNDWGYFDSFLERITNPFSEIEGGQDFASPPKDKERVHATFCGT